MIKDLSISNLTIAKCPYCRKVTHKWSEVYIDQNSKLKKVDSIYISWCEQFNKHVLIDNNGLIELAS